MTLVVFSPAVQPPAYVEQLFKNHNSLTYGVYRRLLQSQHIPWELVLLVLASAGGLEELRYASPGLHRSLF